MSDRPDHLAERVSMLEEQVNLLLKARPGRQLRPVVVFEDGVCGVDPDRDSSDCPDASLWRRSKGCRGTDCVIISSEYYKNYRAKRKRGQEDSQDED